jgi:hypothetical protein
LMMPQESGARVVPAMMKHETPRVVPATMKQQVAAESVPAKDAVSKRVQRPPSRSQLAAFDRRADSNARVVFASRQMGTPVPVLVTTTVLMESGQPGVPNQLWVVRMWHVALYYPAAEQSKQVPPRKI